MATDINKTLELAKKGDINEQFNAGYYYYSQIKSGIYLTTRSKKFILNKKDKYLYGSNLPTKDEIIKEMLKYFKQAAKAGHTTAQYYMGLCYSDYGIQKPDYKEAVKWFKLAADKGDSEAQYEMAKAYFYERGVKLNSKEEDKYLLLSLAQNNKKALCRYAQRHIWDISRKKECLLYLG